ncbi:MAG: DUF58 domain-containing protein [Clostridiales bacterium]|nr:DUF58 domain-containing protein [Clostridiales bacterium]
MFKNWCIYIILFIASVVFFLYYQMWLSWYCLLIILLILPVSLISAIVNGIFTTAVFKAPKNVRMNEEAEITVCTENRSLFSFSICRLCLVSRDLMTDVTKKYKKVEFESRGEMSFPINTEHCGTYEFTATRLRVYDLFRLFYFPKRIKLKEEVVIRPVPVVPDVMPESNGFKAKVLKKSNASYSEIYDVRDYVVGDPIKNIHWKLSAKRDHVLVKEPQEACYGHARVYVELKNDREQMDKRLGELLFTSTYFLNHDIEHKIRILPPMKREIAFNIESQRDLDTAMLKILHMRIPKETGNGKKA